MTDENTPKPSGDEVDATDEDIILDNLMDDLLLHSLRSSELEIRETNSYALYDALPYFGLYSLSLSEAAELAAIDVWFSGGYDIEIEEGEYYCPTHKLSLKKEIDSILKRLVAAAEQGKLKLEYERLNFDDDKIIPEYTFIGYEELRKWLEKRGIIGDSHGGALSSWLYDRIEVQTSMREEIHFFRHDPELYKRTRRGRGEYLLDGEIKEEPKSLLDAQHAIKELVLYNKSLSKTIKNQEEAEPEKPLNKRQADNLMRIIGALFETVLEGEKFKNQTELIEYLDKRYKGYGGLTDSNLQKLIPKVKKLLEQP